MKLTFFSNKVVFFYKTKKSRLKCKYIEKEKSVFEGLSLKHVKQIFTESESLALI